MRTNRLLRGFTLVELLIVIAVVGILIAGMVVVFGDGCGADDSQAIRAATTNGFSNPRVTKRSIVNVLSSYGCSDEDDYAYAVTATNVVGKEVDITVCCGGGLSSKGCTIRTQ